MLGVHTTYDLLDVIEGRKSVRDVIETGLEGVQFISGGSGVYELLKIAPGQLMDIMADLSELEDVADTIIFDTSAGLTDTATRLIRASHEIILVTTPEPTAMVDAYALLKMVILKWGTGPASVWSLTKRRAQEAVGRSGRVHSHCGKKSQHTDEQAGVYFARCEHAKRDQKAGAYTGELSKMRGLIRYQCDCTAVFEHTGQNIEKAGCYRFPGEFLFGKKPVPGVLDSVCAGYRDHRRTDGDKK